MGKNPGGLTPNPALFPICYSLTYITDNGDRNRSGSHHRLDAYSGQGSAVNVLYKRFHLIFRITNLQGRWGNRGSEQLSNVSKTPLWASNRTGIESTLSEAKVCCLYQIAFLCSPEVWWKLQWLNMNSWYICLLLQFIPSTLHKQVFTKTDFNRKNTIHLSFPASLMLILEFLRKVKGPTQIL